LKQLVEDSLEKPEEELKKSLPDMLSKVGEVNIEDLVEEFPELVPKMMRKLNQIDVKDFVENEPEASAKFMDLLWSSVPLMVEKDAEAKTMLEQSNDAKVNFEATDSSLTSCLILSGGKLSGGSGLLDNYDLKLFGPTESIVGLLTGKINPIQGFMQGKYKMDGNVSMGMKLSPLLTSVTKMFN